MSDLKLARINLKAAREQRQHEILKSVIENPVFDLIAGYTALELLSRYPANRPILGPLATGVGFAGVTGCAAAKALGPAMPYLAQMGEAGMATVAKMAPMLAAGAV